MYRYRDIYTKCGKRAIKAEESVYKKGCADTAMVVWAKNGGIKKKREAPYEGEGEGEAKPSKSNPPNSLIRPCQ
jgi:hypothetical protein